MIEERSSIICCPTALPGRSTCLLSDSWNTARMPVTNGQTDIQRKIYSSIADTPSTRRFGQIYQIPFLQQLHHNGTVHFVSLLLYRLCKSPKLNKDFYQRVRKSHEAGSVYAAYCLYTRQQASSFITLYNHKKRGLRKIEAFHLCQIIENMQIDAHEI